MPQFEVDPKTLEALEVSVLGLAVQLENGPAMRSYMGTNDPTDGEPLSGIRGGQLNGADIELLNFFGEARLTLERIGQNIENVAKALGGAAKNYSHTDAQVMN